ncbi:unnamed protein product [Heligmosomoides polygyrus]|uniref:Bestrophin homolog n=1 Tax=Heligmosomoides polygyrus TaxID=6339 RepID=A0A183FYH8_HELPZ|nr:unnamed protein product [Heligmosomoides polygyrus]
MFIMLYQDKQSEGIHDEENLEIEEDEVDGEWNIINEEEDLNLDQPAGSKTITFSGGQEVPGSGFERQLDITGPHQGSFLGAGRVHSIDLH